MAALSESGSAGGYLLSKGSFPFYCRFVHTEDEGLNRSEVSMHSVGLISQATF